MAVNVCFFSSAHYPFDFRLFHKECKSLARAGYSVTLIALHDRTETVEGVRILPLKRPRNRVYRFVVTAWQAYRMAVREDADIYHFHDPELLLAGLLLRLRGKQVIRDVREDVPRMLLDKYYLPVGTRKLLAWLADKVERFSSRYLSGIVAANPLIAERFERYTKKTILVRNYPDPAELPESELNAARKSLSILYTGVVTESRGIKQLIEAVRLVSKTHPVRLKLAGEFFPSSLELELRNSQGWEYVDYLGRLERAELLKLLPTGYAGAITFGASSHIRLGWPVKLFEYMLAGLPVIASDFPLPRRILSEYQCGLLVTSADPVEIAGAISYLIEHPGDAAAMGARGRQAVETEFNWVGEEAKLLALYDRLSRSSLDLEACRAV
jgi:glycosyltransferase involved in cell wall biosynthesis